MKPSDLLRAAKQRLFTGLVDTPCEALRGDAEYPVYCRALFALKRGFGISPRDGLFGLKPLTVDETNEGFARAIAFAESEAA